MDRQVQFLGHRVMTSHQGMWTLKPSGALLVISFSKQLRKDVKVETADVFGDEKSDAKDNKLKPGEEGTVYLEDVADL